jgi:YesN/AraC family two-component response regulator
MERLSFLSNLTLLLVEDDNETVRQMQIMLRKKTGKIYTANNGVTGLNTYKEVKPDIIVTDLKMPLMGGIEMGREIRKTDKDTPIIITTAYDDVKMVLNAVDVGIKKYIVKPIDTQVLLDALIDAASSVLKLQDSLITADGLIPDREEKLRKEAEIKQIFAGMLKNDTGKGPLSVRVSIKGMKIQIECDTVLTKFELSLLENTKNTRMVNYAREIYYLDRQQRMEREMSRVMGLECLFKDAKTDSKENKDFLAFELKLN